MGEVCFYRYAAIVKNLRGVIYWRGESKDKLDWLLSRFKYRSLGVPPSSPGKLPERKILIKLAYPAQAVMEAASLLSDFMPPQAAEALCLASAYVSPIMVVEGLEDFREAVIKTVRTSASLDERGWRLHMRIANYTTLDFYAWSTENALRALRGNRLIEALRERAQKAAEDEKRYWRLKPGEGRVFLAYLDPLRAVFNAGLRDEFLRLGDDAASALGIVAAISI